MLAFRDGSHQACKNPEEFTVMFIGWWSLFGHCSYSGILTDVKRDNRVLSLVSHAGLKGTLTQMLDQLQRCQKSLNEFLEVSPYQMNFLSIDVCLQR